MSQFRQNSLKTAASVALLMAGLPAITANAASHTAHQPARAMMHSAKLSAFQDQADKFVIDWRSPVKTITFDAPDTDFITSAKLAISADPSLRNIKTGSLFVQFNQTAPVKIKSTGRGFDAQFSLDPAKMKPQNNTIRLFVQSTSDTNCSHTHIGGWVVDLNASKVSMKRQAKTKTLNVGDVEALLSNPLTAPRSVSLFATGADQTALQSLLAQGIGQRMSAAPKFTTLKGKGEFQIIAGRRDEISSYVSNEALLNAEGARLGFDKGRPLRLILTGDTDAEVLALAQAFSQFQLPKTRRLMTSIGEMIVQTQFSELDKRISTKTKLSDLGNSSFEAGWNPADEIYAFNIADPVASQGEVVLELESSKTTLSGNNAVVLRLNDHVIGQTRLNEPKKMVSFKIPEGLLKGQENELRLSADLDADINTACSAQGFSVPNIDLKPRSQLKLVQNGETPLTDLSRFAATGAPFSDANGQDTLIVLPRNNADYNAALTVLSKLAETQANGWSKAHYIRGSANLDKMKKGKNILFILPSTELPILAKRNAPKTVRSALKGNRFEGQNLLSSEAQQYAGVNSQAAYRSIATKTAAQNSVRRGGVAALYASPYQSNKMVGVITNVPGQSFASSVNSLTSEDHWNAIEGSVARWGDNSVFMAELSSPLASFSRTILPRPKAKTIALDLSKFGLTKLEIPSLKLPNWNIAELSNITAALPDFEFKMPSFDGAKLKKSLTFWEADTSNSLPAPIINQPSYSETVSIDSSASTIQTALRPTLPMDYSAQLKKIAEAPSLEAPSLPVSPQSFLEAALPDSYVSAREVRDIASNAAASITAPITDNFNTVNAAMSGHSTSLSTQPNFLSNNQREKQFFDVTWFQNKSETALNWSGERWKIAKRKFATLGIRKDIRNAQQSLSPLGQSWRTQLGNMSFPGKTTAKGSVQKLSAGALLLLLMLGVVIFFLSAANPKSETGQNH